MGDHYSSVLQWVGFVIMYKSLIASCLAVATLASPEADADAGLLVSAVVPAVHTNALVGSGGISPAWPATRALGLDSTCYGCRPLAAVHLIHKREAEAEADPYYGYGYLAAPLYRYRYGPGIALHPGVATSFVARSPQGLRGKRSADAEPGVVVGHTVGLGLNNIHGLSHFGSGYTVSQLHPSGHSFQAIDRLHHKREAEAEPEAEADAEADPYYGYGYGLGYYGLGYSRLGYYGKREAEAEPEADAEADPYYGFGYSGLGYAGLGYAGLGYSRLGYAGLGYSRLGYSRLGYSGLGHYGRGYYLG